LKLERAAQKMGIKEKPSLKTFVGIYASKALKSPEK
jgi:hypothetical protein